MDSRRSPSDFLTNGVLQFQVGNGAFTDLTNLTYSPAANGSTNAPLDLSGYATLQNVGENTNVTFRIVNYNAGSPGGTWYVYDNGNSPAPDLVVQGTITQIANTNPPAAAQAFSLVWFTNSMNFNSPSAALAARITWCKRQRTSSHPTGFRS